MVQDGGSMELSCVCQEGYTGQNCENYVAKERIHHDSSGFSSSAVVIPLILFILIAIAASAFYVFLRKRNFGKDGGGGPASNISNIIGGGVVSFRQGSNVEFGSGGQQEQQVRGAIINHNSLT